ncbi:MAG: fibronectin type III-like domain-contianing protein [Christensenellales bacterium]
MEVAAVELIGFAKTDDLVPGASQRLTIAVEKQNFTSYDTYGLGSYLLDAGTYYLAAGRNAHDALNNILAAKGYTVSDGMDADGDAALCTAIEVQAQDRVTYTVSAETGAKIENRLADADINRNAGAEGNWYVRVRSNWLPWLKKDSAGADRNVCARTAKRPRTGHAGRNADHGRQRLDADYLRGKDYDAPEWTRC